MAKKIVSESRKKIKSINLEKLLRFTQRFKHSLPFFIVFFLFFINFTSIPYFKN